PAQPMSLRRSPTSTHFPYTTLFRTSPNNIYNPARSNAPKTTEIRIFTAVSIYPSPLLLLVADFIAIALFVIKLFVFSIALSILIDPLFIQNGNLLNRLYLICCTCNYGLCNNKILVLNKLQYLKFC